MSSQLNKSTSASNKTPAAKKAPARKNSYTKLAASGSPSDPEAPSFGMLGFGVPAIYTFCAKTCLNLLPTLSTEDIDFEYNRLRLIDSTFTGKATRPETKQAAIKQYLTRQIVVDIDQSMNSLTAAANLLSCTVNGECEKAVKNLTERALTAIEEVSDETKKQTTLITQQTATLISEAPSQNLDATSEVASMPLSPVRLLECDLSELTFHELSSELNFDLHHPGGRATSFFGSVPYTYGRTSHPVSVKPLPSTLKHVYEKLQQLDADITPENYTCLCTLYKDGSVGIPMHNDSEPSIVEDSQIYTVSIGATRNLRISSTVGPFVEHNIPLEHGSLYVMSRADQDNWRHGIDRDIAVRNPRISLTFRKLKQPESCTEPAPQTLHRIPPVAPPAQNSSSQSRHSRVLFIHDSIHRDTPEWLFDQIPGHRCQKRLNYQLTDSLNHDIKHAKTVIISCGINDLSRYGKSAKSLADNFCPRLVESCKSNESTQFVFCALSSTKISWLNREIDDFNLCMVNLARVIPNLTFYDAHAVIKRVHSYYVWDRNDRHGIHLHHDVRRAVAYELVNCVGKLCGSELPRHRNCAWLYHHEPNSPFRYHRS